MQPSRFTDLKLIGQGGFAKVYEANDATLGEIAVKFSKDTSEDDVERFVREVELQADLNHPNIVEILDFDLADKPPWYAMDRAHGNLSQAATSVSWDDSVFLSLFQDVLSGVGHAHGQHILHRDLKPGNILVFLEQNAPVARVADFGLSRRFTRNQMEFQTATGFAAGTDFYTAPEQWDDFREANEAADVYSLAKILESLTNTRPSIAQTNPQLLDCIRVATRADPLERYQSVEQFAVAVGLATTHSTQGNSPQQNLALATRNFIVTPDDTISVDRLMDALEKLNQGSGTLRIALARLSDTALQSLCKIHAGRMRSLLLEIIFNNLTAEPVDAALGTLDFFEKCLDFTSDSTLSGIALFGLVKLASLYEMDEFVKPAFHQIKILKDSDTQGAFLAQLAKDPLAFRWLNNNKDQNTSSFEHEGL